MKATHHSHTIQLVLRMDTLLIEDEDNVFVVIVQDVMYAP